MNVGKKARYQVRVAVETLVAPGQGRRAEPQALTANRLVHQQQHGNVITQERLCHACEATTVCLKC